MLKPEKPKLEVTGITNLNTKIKKHADSYHNLKGGDSPVISISKLIQLLEEIRQKDSEAVVVSSKSSLYVGKIKQEQYNQELKKYQQQKAEYKEYKKDKLLKQLAKLEEDDD